MQGQDCPKARLWRALRATLDAPAPVSAPFSTDDGVAAGSAAGAGFDPDAGLRL